MLIAFKILFLLALLAFPSFASVESSENKDSWNCENPTWGQEPSLTEGVFSAVIQATCQVYIQKDAGISWLFEKLQSEYKKSEKYEIHQGPFISHEGSFLVVNYDLTDKLNEEGTDLAIRQDVILKTDQKKELNYLTQSKAIQASGTAAYLRAVSFETEVKAKPNAYEVNLKNRVEIEKPWFALGFLFKPMSESITREKFVKAQEKLIRYLLPES